MAFTQDLSGGAFTFGGSSSAQLAANGLNYSSGTAVLALGNTTFSNNSSSATTAQITPTNIAVTLKNLTGFGGTISGGATITMKLDGTSTGNAITGTISDYTNSGFTQVVAITKQNSSTWTLSGSNSYTGATTVTAGTLVGIGANAFGSTNGISIAAASTATLSLRGDSSTSFVKTSDSSLYAITTSANGATLNADRATVAGTSAKTMTIGTLLINTAITNVTNFTGANNTSLSIGAVTTGNSVSGTETLQNDIAGGGSLTLASIAVNRTTTPTLAFAGNGNTTVTGNITQAAPTILTKSGAGTLTLGGTNSYTGVTTVSAGNLSVTGSLGATAVSVSNLATLSGNGNIGGNVTIASGATHSLAVAATAGTQVTRAITGTLTLTSGNILDLAAASTPADGVYVLATATVGITGSPTTVNYNGITGTVSVDTASTPKRLLLTVTSGAPEIAVEQPAATNINSGGSKDFGTVTLGANTSLTFTIRNTGSSALNLSGSPKVAVTGTNAADYTVTAQPSTPVTSGGGTTTFTVQFAPGAVGARSAVLTILNDDSDEGTFTINVTGTGQSLYDAWGNRTFTNAFTDKDPTHNPDFDSLTNLQEYAFGTDPTVSSGGSIVWVNGGAVTNTGLPVAFDFSTGSGGVDYRAVFGRRKDYVAAGLTYTVQFSADMILWQSSVATPTLLTDPGAGNPSEIEAVSVPYPSLFVPLNAGGVGKASFLRVGVSQ